jgi:hypothetical protein
MKKILGFSPLLALLLLGACVTTPTGPSVLALPGTGKSFDQFRVDDGMCRQYAYQQVGGTTPNVAASDSGIRSAAVGTLLGAAAGAAINGGRGAGVGAGAGLALGGLTGAGTAQTSGYTSQQRYDMAYVQCMYAQGDRVPVSGRMMSELNQQRYSPPPPPPGNPSPPPGAMAPPPPPPGATAPSGAPAPR